MFMCSKLVFVGLTTIFLLVPTVGALLICACTYTSNLHASHLAKRSFNIIIMINLNNDYIFLTVLVMFTICGSESTDGAQCRRDSTLHLV